MNPEIQKLLDYMHRLAPPREVPMDDTPLVHNYMTLYMARLLALISDEQAQSASKLESIHRSIRRLTIWLVSLTIALSILTVPLAYHAYLVIKEHHKNSQSQQRADEVQPHSK